MLAMPESARWRVPFRFLLEELLGLVMAHEVGHVLLGTNAHSTRASCVRLGEEGISDARDWEEFEFTQVQTSNCGAASPVRMSPKSDLPAKLPHARLMA